MATLTATPLPVEIDDRYYGRPKTSPIGFILGKAYFTGTAFYHPA